MPLKLNVGASKKVGEANYGSRGASVNLEVEVDAGLVGDPARLREQIRQLFGLVRSALDEEPHNGNGHGPAGQAKPRPPDEPPPQGKGPPSGSGRSGLPPATLSQVRAVYGLARQRGADLGGLLSERWRVRRPEELNIRQASEGIDCLKNVEGQAAG